MLCVLERRYKFQAFPSLFSRQTVLHTSLHFIIQEMPNWNKILTHPGFNVVFFLLVRQVTQYFKLDSGEYTTSIRAFYLGAQSIIILLTLYLLSVIRKKNDNTVLRYVEPAKKQWDGTETVDRLIETTHKDYDIAEVEKQMKQGFTSIAIVAFLHLNFGYVQPLLIQSVLNFKTFLLTKEARIHFFNGNTKTGELRRPFRIESAFGGLANEKVQPKTDKGSIKRAEKALKTQ